MEESQMTMLIQFQQKMSDDISEIKATMKEAAQIVSFVRRDQDELKTRLDRIESSHQNCPARLKHQSWSLTIKDLFLFFTFIGTILSIVMNLRGKT